MHVKQIGFYEAEAFRAREAQLQQQREERMLPAVTIDKQRGKLPTPFIPSSVLGTTNQAFLL